ncbi:iron complex transport system substrate-binding protein [Actinomadura pelletieri DSM 43383]|uniref:Iron complex transport system substrate-binding protein n=1 Tax=Actinomadura pelletieri DSM 43383 TaxID=1120940 RepID=A0A495QU30_9ACTN|nr:ABC transporter substrate-binding protein [Actinomadura pelletieri]RKS76999.1 iron complex transport system substrate-binding protein [Actinomadura pelletieri DSM 43383]
MIHVLRRSRPLVAVVAALVAALTLAGCGDSDDAGSDGKGASAEKRTVQATNGSVTVPANPKRIVAISYAAGALLDVGVVPIGTTKVEEPLELTPEQTAQISKSTEIGAGDQINLEKVAELRPDLIIVEGADFGWPIDKLGKIAPTLYFEVAKPSELVGAAEKIAQAVGKEAELKRLKDAYTAKIDQVKGAYAGPLKDNRFALVSTYGDGKFYIGTRTSWMGQVLHSLGAGFAKESDRTDTHENEYSQEKISSLADADVVLIGNSGGKLSPATEEMLATSQWKLLKAAKKNQVHGVNFSFADRYTTLTAVLSQIETLLKGLG